MTLYLTEATSPADIRAAKASGHVHAVKYYPAGATTNSQSGVTDLSRCHDVFEAMQDVGMPLLLHGEVTDGDVDVFDRESRFIDDVLVPTIARFPKLRVVFEHITTRRAAEYVTGAREGVAATITPQHLLHNRNAIFEGGIRPHYYCLPILKTEPDREALLTVATSGNPRFFLGTDSAPHAQHTKENACGCAGMFSALGEKLYVCIGLVIGLVVGPAQAASRTLMVRLAPADRVTQFFGLFALSGKVTSFMGPLLVAIVTTAFASQKAGMAVLVGFFAVGVLILSRVKV
jgi:dihydroorotase (homodimeric type)